MKISDFLMEGRENAVTGGELALMLNCNIREVTAMIEAERREGAPICASMGQPFGYFLAESEEELMIYCKSLGVRIKSMNETRRALTDILKARQAQIEKHGI